MELFVMADSRDFSAPFGKTPHCGRNDGSCGTVRYNLFVSTEDNYHPIDYLMIGHLTIDKTPQGDRLGGTAMYSALTARALGLRVGVYTSWGEEISLDNWDDIPVVNLATERSTSFENFNGPQGRRQRLLHAAPFISSVAIPEPWRSASIVHIGPVAQEIDHKIAHSFPSALIGITPQGFMRQWDPEGWVSATDWDESTDILQSAGAAVVSIEDVSGDEEKIAEMANSCPVLAVTEGEKGVRLYWNGDARRFPPSQVEPVDTVGAGDIFAAAMFTRLYMTRDPWESARFAAELAAYSVTRSGVSSIPTREEISTSLVQVL